MIIPQHCQVATRLRLPGQILLRIGCRNIAILAVVRPVLKGMKLERIIAKPLHTKPAQGCLLQEWTALW